MANYRELKNRTRISSTLENSIMKQLKEYSNKTCIPISKILDMAVSKFIKENSK